MGLPSQCMLPGWGVADGGKDVIVSTKINTVNILGQSFTSFNGKGIQICFECKSTDNSILRYDKISSSSSRMQFQDTEKYDYCFDMLAKIYL